MWKRVCDSKAYDETKLKDLFKGLKTALQKQPKKHCPIKEEILKTYQNSQENTFARASFFIKLQDLVSTF